MNIMAGLFIAGLVVGAIIGYVFAWPVLVILTLYVMVLFCVWFVLKDSAKAGGSAIIGVIFMGGSSVVGFLLETWGAAIVRYWTSISSGIMTFWEVLQPHILH